LLDPLFSRAVFVGRFRSPRSVFPRGFPDAPIFKRVHLLPQVFFMDLDELFDEVQGGLDRIVMKGNGAVKGDEGGGRGKIPLERVDRLHDFSFVPGQHLGLQGHLQGRLEEEQARIDILLFEIQAAFVDLLQDDRGILPPDGL
jgi:hypothetical protein